MGSWFNRWLVGKISTYIPWCCSMRTPTFLHPEGRSARLSLCQILQKDAVCFCFFCCGQIHQYACMGEAGRARGGDNVKVRIAAIIVNQSAVDARLALALHHTWTVLIGYMVYCNFDTKKQHCKSCYFSPSDKGYALLLANEWHLSRSREVQLAWVKLCSLSFGASFTWATCF